MKALLACCLLLGGCCTMQPSLDKIAGQENLLTKCPDLEQLPDGTGATVTRWSNKTILQYKLCQARHEGLVDAFRAPNKGKP